jgi:hypothetical protein
MPDLWDTNPDHVFNGPRKPDPAPNGNNDHTKEVPLRDHAAVTGSPPTP